MLTEAMPLPFGTLLCPAAMVTYLWGGEWMRAYVSFFTTRGP